MLSWLLLAALSASAPTSVHVLRTGSERTPLPLVVNSPANDRLAGLTLSDILALAGDAAAKESDFAVIEMAAGSCVDPSHADQLFTCLGRAALEILGHPPYLVVLSIRPVAGGDRVVTSLLDLGAIARILRDADFAAADDDLEARIIDEAVVAKRDPELVESEESLRTYLSKLFDQTFQPSFERSGNWRPYGAIELHTDVSDAAVRLDDREVGTTAPGTTRLESVAAGRRTIAISHPDFERFEITVELAAGQTASVAVALIERPDPVVVRTRTAVEIAGAGVGVAGVALIAYAIAKPKRSAICVEIQEGACDGSTELARFGSSEGLLTSPNGSGPAIAAIGYSLLGMGATWSLATLLFDDGRRLPWYELAAGVVVFGASLGLSYALDGENAVSRRN